MIIRYSITDFEMFEGLEATISRFLLKEKDYLIDDPIYDIKLVFVESGSVSETGRERVNH